MKTSTKLIIIFFTCIPMSLLAYNFILNVQFKKGNVVRELHPEDNNTYINKTGLPAFKHIVLNGSLDVGNGASEQWMAHVWIGGSIGTRNNGSGLSVVETLKDNLKTSVKNDTLFITFHTTGKYDVTATTWNHRSDIVKIYADQVKSVSISYANVTIGSNPGATDSLRLVVKDYSHYNVQNLRLQKLAVIAKDSSSFSIGQSNRIGTLNYSLQGKSLLNVEESPAKQYLAAHIDSTSRIQLTGKASSLQKQLH